MAPAVFCSGNCGAGDTVSQFYSVSVPIYTTPFASYVNGVLYEFTQTAGTRCEWNRVTPGRYPWDIELLSRYPDGWNFPAVEPIPGKWTYRLSIDDLLPVPFLHGWFHDFDRFVPPAVDPGHHCTTEEPLQNYVPLTTRPDAVITPVSELPPPPDFKKHSTPCFCLGECPQNRRPTEKYFVQSNDITTLPGYVAGKLYAVTLPGTNPCEWNAVEPTGGGTTELLSKANIAPINADHAYELQLVILNLIGGVSIFRGWRQWDNTGDELEGYDALCDVEVILNTIVGTGHVTLTPVPWWLCDDAAARIWIAAQS